MNTIQLIQINEDGSIPGGMEGMADMVRELCAAYVDVYQASGFEPPWIGYLAEMNGALVGTCGFKGPPVENQVEIAYFTFPEYEANGFATQMAQILVQMARDTVPDVVVCARTLPEITASSSILKKLGFAFHGELEDPEDGTVWEWCLPNERAA